MELKLNSEDIAIDSNGVTFIFAPKTHQDLVFAMPLLEYIKADKMLPGAIDRDSCIKHVFSRLKEIKGSITSDGKELGLEDLKELLPKSQSKVVIPIVSAWAIKIIEGHGFFDLEAQEKNVEVSS